MAGVPMNRGCYECGSLSHWVRDCPQRARQFRPPVTGANAVPIGAPMLTLPTPSSSSATFNSSLPLSSSHEGEALLDLALGINHQQDLGDPIKNVWIFVIINIWKISRRKRSEKKRRREPDYVRRKRIRNLNGRERESFEQEMGKRLEMRMPQLCPVKEGGTEVGSVGVKKDELAILKAENEMLRLKLEGAKASQEEDRFILLQWELIDLRKQMAGNGLRRMRSLR
ncbi:hypothetical protein CBR_g21250 [Chara braunii]|uniref:CCHC-type domain-containing protein n=1 Tax=Chara braunii TaxID=69332 RepID=A0A388L127_CHABU|nr:hypothetical protein CBR_g21250 [Chara braunii]|eukprot:GBG76010.1 hypothetical protein CBR_g21250 [Chara braunii]